MTFEQMRQLVEIYRSGSINRAAQTMFMSQSSLSKSISALEKELGREILVRSYTGTSLTAFGEEILRYAQDMLRSEEAIRLLARENSLKKTAQSACFCSASALFCLCVSAGIQSSYSRVNSRPSYTGQRIGCSL